MVAHTLLASGTRRGVGQRLWEEAVIVSLKWLALLALPLGVASGAQNASMPSLPGADSDPLRVDMARDPILALARRQADRGLFQDVVASAVRRHPGTAEALAGRQEATAVLEEARERQLPSIDLSVTSYRVLSREFSNDLENIVERSRPNSRTDAIAAVNYTLFDFGAGEARVQAAGARLRAAAADVETGADRIALNAVAAWYDVFAFRALLAVATGAVRDQEGLRADVRTRIAGGASAAGDVALVDNFVASAGTRLAEIRRQLANAESRYTELVGAPPPADLARAPVPAVPRSERIEAELAARRSPAVRAATLAAEAAQQDAQAVRSDNLPQIGIGLDAGRYGVFENDRDYDIRARVTLRQRFFGGIDARARQAAARATGAEARASRIGDEAARDASIAWSDVAALEQQLAALEASYIATRRTRDVVAARFSASRGTLFDVASAESSYFQTATAYIRTLSELDAARYVLLSRTGTLLPALGIDAVRFVDVPHNGIVR
ncbi:MAG TPA: TolC family protein [Sphingomonadaceae bacterium]|nr:TolC family protein [Sphingomonadaceae bacterium]